MGTVRARNTIVRRNPQHTFGLPTARQFVHTLRCLHPEEVTHWGALRCLRLSRVGAFACVSSHTDGWPGRQLQLANRQKYKGDYLVAHCFRNRHYKVEKCTGTQSRVDWPRELMLLRRRRCFNSVNCNVNLRFRGSSRFSVLNCVHAPEADDGKQMGTGK